MFATRFQLITWAGGAGRRGARELHLAFLISFAFLSGARAQDEAEKSRDEIRTLQGDTRSVRELPIAVGVITGDELRELGVHTLPEAFRYVPGVSVFQLNGFTYAVGVRGVKNEFDARTHVYLDGRLVNVPEFGGVDWESIPVSVDDIERIEIHRAPGVVGESGSAPLGVIRIWTRRPADTKKVTYSGYAGTQTNQIHFGRVAAVSGPFSAKASVEYRHDDGIAGTTPSGAIAPRTLDDDRELVKINALGAWEISPESNIDVRVTALTGRIGETAADPVSNGSTKTRNISAAATYNREIAERARLSISYSFEDVSLDVLDHPSGALHAAGDDINLDRHTHAISGSSRIELLPVLDLIVGGGWRQDELSFDRNDPETDTQELLHGHAGAELRPVDRLLVSAGASVERDLFAGVDVSPFAGAVYRLSEAHSLRASYRVGRRRPTLSETRIAFVVLNPFPPPQVLPVITGNRDLERETLESFELGYRGWLEELGLLVDVQGFFREIDETIEFVPDPTSPVPGAVTFANLGTERTLGIELFADWALSETLSVFGHYTWHDVQDARIDAVDRTRPRHVAGTGLRMRFTGGMLDGLSALVSLNYVSRIQQDDATGTEQTVDERFRLDFRIAKKLLDDRVEIALLARNVLDNETLEFRPAPGSNANGDFGAERAFFLNLRIDL